jgi:uncharacterized protein YqhQ
VKVENLEEERTRKKKRATTNMTTKGILVQILSTLKGKKKVALASIDIEDITKKMEKKKEEEEEKGKLVLIMWVFRVYCSNGFVGIDLDRVLVF